ncbi:MAG: SMC-Scp complex subunit ScpB [Endomicrobiales bacterium]|nr:SMC-Scp complex subunit ScpB [Endomicrobiales bacterium]
METQEVKKIVEALLFLTDQPISVSVIKAVLGEAAKDQNLEEIISQIDAEYRERNSPMELRFIAGGWQFSTKKEFSSWIRKLYRERTTLRLSNSALESLAIVAYKQPVTRSEIEEIRGVETSGVLETLLERKLVRIVGRKETIGRPLLYGTTLEFLRHFGLSHLSELPIIEELVPPEQAAPQVTIEEETPELPFAGEGAEQEQPEENRGEPENEQNS